jgi:hypothetical protein
MRLSVNIATTTFYWFFCSFPLLGALFALLKQKNFDLIALLAAAVLTAMISITALLYSRAQVWHEGRIQRRCLYAAEHCFDATLLFGLGSLAASALLIAAHFLNDKGINGLDLTDLALLIGLVLMQIFWAFHKFIYAIRVAIHVKPWDLSPKKFIRQYAARSSQG